MSFVWRLIERGWTAVFFLILKLPRSKIMSRFFSITHTEREWHQILISCHLRFCFRVETVKEMKSNFNFPSPSLHVLPCLTTCPTFTTTWGGHAPLFHSWTKPQDTWAPAFEAETIHLWWEAFRFTARFSFVHSPHAHLYASFSFPYLFCYKLKVKLVQCFNSDPFAWI